MFERLKECLAKFEESKDEVIELKSKMPILCEDLQKDMSLLRIVVDNADTIFIEE